MPRPILAPVERDEEDEDWDLEFGGWVVVGVVDVVDEEVWVVGDDVVVEIDVLDEVLDVLRVDTALSTIKRPCPC